MEWVYILRNFQNIPKRKNKRSEQNKKDATLSFIYIHLFEVRIDKNKNAYCLKQ